MNSKNDFSEKALNLKNVNGSLESKANNHHGKNEKLPDQNGISQSKTAKNYATEKIANEGVSNRGSVVDKIQNKVKETSHVNTENHAKNKVTNEYKTKEENFEEEDVNQRPADKTAINKKDATVIGSFNKGQERENGRLENFNKKSEINQDFTKKNSTLPDDVTDKKALDSTQLMTLFMDGLKDIYWAEQTLTKFIPQLMKQSSSEALTNTLSAHLSETEHQITTLEHVFEIAGSKAKAVKCEVMEGLMKEATTTIESCEEGSMRDVAILAAAHKIEHYEIASYNTLRYYAEILEIPEADVLLDDILNEERSADRRLFELASSLIKLDTHEMVETE